MLQCFVCSLIPQVSEKKLATGQSFIRKEIISYRIGTLVVKMNSFVPLLGKFEDVKSPFQIIRKLLSKGLRGSNNI